MLDIAESNSQKFGFDNNFILGSYLDVKINQKHDAAISMGSEGLKISSVHS